MSQYPHFMLSSRQMRGICFCFISLCVSLFVYLYVALYICSQTLRSTVMLYLYKKVVFIFSFQCSPPCNLDHNSDLGWPLGCWRMHGISETHLDTDKVVYCCFTVILYKVKSSTIVQVTCSCFRIGNQLLIKYVYIL